MEVISTRMTANVVAPASQVLANPSRMMGHKALGLLVRHNNCAMRVKDSIRDGARSFATARPSVTT
jgi:hypothetical protein